MADIELPRDAVGRGIPPDTMVPFDGNGNAYRIVRWAFATEFGLKDVRSGSRRAVTDANVELDPEPMYPTPPDSREKPSEDSHGAVEANDVRMYLSGSGICLDRAVRNTSGGRSPKALGRIPDRIREPRVGANGRHRAHRQRKCVRLREGRAAHARGRVSPPALRPDSHPHREVRTERSRP